jgi:hypothetical protein
LTRLDESPDELGRGIGILASMNNTLFDLRAPLTALAMALALGICAAILAGRGSGALATPVPTRLSTAAGSAAVGSGLVLEVEAERVLPRAASTRLEGVRLRVSSPKAGVLLEISAERGRWQEETAALRGEVVGRLTPAGVAWLGRATGREAQLASACLSASRVRISRERMELSEFSIRVEGQASASLEGKSLVIVREEGEWCSELQGTHLWLQLAKLRLTH